MNATWWSVCAWCDRAVHAGQLQELELVPEVGARWVHPECATAIRQDEALEASC